MSALADPKEYVVSIATNNLHEAVTQLGSALYDLLEQSLMTTDEEDEESDFGRFARETFSVLARHPEQLAEGMPWQEPEDDESEIDSELVE